MKHDARRKLENFVKGEFHLPLLKLHGPSAQEVYFGIRVVDSAPTLLVLHAAAEGERELETVSALDEREGIGITRCPACAAAASGWPRSCGVCGYDLWSRGSTCSADEVRGIVDGAWPGSRLLGSFPGADQGAAAMHLVQAPGGWLGRTPGLVVGMMHDRDGAGETVLVPCWAMDSSTLERFPTARVQSPSASSTAEAGKSAATTSPATSTPEGAQADPPHRRQRLLWAGAAVLLLGMPALLSITRTGGQAADRPPPDPPPVIVPVVSVRDSVDSIAVVPPPADSVSLESRGRARNPARTRVPVVAADTVSTPEPVPDPEQDRQQVVQAARAFGEAFATRDMQRVRAAYPGISPGEEEGWSRGFERGFELRTRFVLNQSPAVVGDSAIVEFTLGLRYARQRQCLVFVGHLIRDGGGWILNRLNSGAHNLRACRSLHEAWDRHPDPAPR